MKKFLLLFTFLFTVFGFAQNKQLYSKEWKLTSLYLNGVNETIPSTPKNIYINFNNVFSSFGFNSKVCAEILGPITYSTSASEFTITSVNTSSVTCDDISLQSFQPKYFLFFNKNLSGNNKFTYNINATTTGYELIIYNSTNDVAKFEYNFPKGDIANKVWSINSLLINSVTYTKPSNFANGNTNFSDIINTSYFNSSQITPYYSGNYIYNIGMSTTLAQHYDDAVNNFDNLYHGVFWRNAENNPYTYEINGNQLVITSSTGNKAFYDYVENQGIALKANKWNINSLKIGSQTFTPTINSPLTFLENTINASYFNLLKGNINYISDSFNIYNSDVTIVDSFDPPIAEFDFYYLENFWGKRANSYYIIPNNPFNYSISTDGNTLTITNSNGDVATYNKVILATQEIQKNNLKLYPNPVSDFITIENLKTNSSIKILDTSGKVVLNKKLSGNSIDVKSLPKGIYFIQIEGEKPLKFIKK